MTHCGHTTGMNFHVCNEHHKKGIVLTNSRVEAKKLEKLQRFLPQCECRDLIKSKGICVGWKNGNIKPMSDSIKNYLQRYWRNEGLLNDNTVEEFSSELEKISFVIFNGVHYEVGDHVITRSDAQEMHPFKSLDRGLTHKAKITMLFVHEFLGHHRLFFHAKYFKQVLKLFYI